MPLNISSDHVNHLAEELAARLRLTKTEGVKFALENELRRQDERVPLLERLRPLRQGTRSSSPTQHGRLLRLRGSARARHAVALQRRRLQQNRHRAGQLSVIEEPPSAGRPFAGHSPREKYRGRRRPTASAVRRRGHPPRSCGCQDRRTTT
ncbi:MAG: hypothetical protein FJX11_21625 [Alphaproteobacteria bacterium]|nr:hypothetical protein [Alphaproteobacteria bacterium]